MGFISCLADPDVWLRPASKTDGYQYYEYVLVYVNDVLALSHQGHMIMKGLEDFYRLKDGYHKPDLYLGAEVKEWIFLDQPTTKYWALFSSRYVKEAIKNVASKLQEQERKQRKSHQPMASNYHPELTTIFGQKARQRVLDSYSLSKNIDRLQLVYQEVLAKKQSSLSYFH